MSTLMLPSEEAAASASPSSCGAKDNAFTLAACAALACTCAHREDSSLSVSEGGCKGQAYALAVCAALACTCAQQKSDDRFGFAGKQAVTCRCLPCARAHLSFAQPAQTQPNQMFLLRHEHGGPGPSRPSSQMTTHLPLKPDRQQRKAVKCRNQEAHLRPGAVGALLPDDDADDDAEVLRVKARTWKVIYCSLMFAHLSPGAIGALLPDDDTWSTDASLSDSSAAGGTC